MILEEYEKYRVIRDKNYISDFDRVVKKILFGILAGVVIIAVVYAGKLYIRREIGNVSAIKGIVIEFGGKMKNVSLQSPREVVEKDIKNNYSKFVTEELLAKWIADFWQVPGKITSSPWPDRIEIQEYITKIGGDKYKVSGKVIEVTSVEEIQGGAANEYNVEMIVEKQNNKWLISKFENSPSFSIEFSGEVAKDQKFEEDIDGENLFFRLIPDQTDKLGWIISVGTKESDNNFAKVATPPYYGVSPIYIEGWNFRNVDNTGPNEGIDAPNVPQKIREFYFVLNDADYRKALNTIQKDLIDKRSKIIKGHGILTIKDLKLNNLEHGKQAGIDFIKFDVELRFPSLKTEMADWQVYKNNAINKIKEE